MDGPCRLPWRTTTCPSWSGAVLLLNVHKTWAMSRKEGTLVDPWLLSVCSCISCGGVRGRGGLYPNKTTAKNSWPLQIVHSIFPLQHWGKKGRWEAVNDGGGGGRSIEYRRNHVNRPSVAYPHSQRESKRRKGKVVILMEIFEEGGMSSIGGIMWTAHQWLIYTVKENPRGERERSSLFFLLFKGDILGFFKYHLECCSLLCHINQVEFSPNNIPHYHLVLRSTIC